MKQTNAQILLYFEDIYCVLDPGGSTGHPDLYGTGGSKAFRHQHSLGGCPRTFAQPSVVTRAMNSK